MWSFLLLSSLLVTTVFTFTVLPSAPLRSSSTLTTCLQMSSSSLSSSKHQLLDLPVSNNGARCRIILYKKEIPESELAIISPMELGGLKSEEYLAINPQGKMPALIRSDNNMKLYESDTIARYLLKEYADRGPSFQQDNPKSNLIARIHDMYLTTVQGCLYKAAPPFAQFGTRQEAIDEYVKQLNVIEGLIDPSQGQYLAGDEISFADATVFPSLVFANHMLPKFDVEPALPPKLANYFVTMKMADSAFSKVHDEIMGALQAWEDRGRWDDILGAGFQDKDPPTLFDKIINKEIPAEIVRDTADCLAFKDINPVAPAHVLVIPKNRNGLNRITNASAEHTEILGKCMVLAAEIAKDKDLGFGDGARIVINDGPDGGQEVMHLHLHVLGGRSMAWPPG